MQDQLQNLTVFWQNHPDSMVPEEYIAKRAELLNKLQESQNQQQELQNLLQLRLSKFPFALLSAKGPKVEVQEGTMPPAVVLITPPTTTRKPTTTETASTVQTTTKQATTTQATTTQTTTTTTTEASTPAPIVQRYVQNILLSLKKRKGIYN